MSSTRDVADSLRRKIIEHEKAMNAATRELSRLESACRHQWTDPVAAHIRHEGYTSPGDAEGTMGIDRRGPMYVEPRTEQRWSRTCTVCGKVEHTSQTEQRATYTHTPRFTG